MNKSKLWLRISLPFCIAPSSCATRTVLPQGEICVNHVTAPGQGYLDCATPYSTRVMQWNELPNNSFCQSQDDFENLVKFFNEKR